MEANINLSALSAVLVSMAAGSLASMFSLTQINQIVHGELYNFGLQFSYRWALPYWLYSGIVFGLSWISISLSIVVAFYIFNKNRVRATELKDDSSPEFTHSIQQLEGQRKQRKLVEYSQLAKQTTQTTDDKFQGALPNGFDKSNDPSRSTSSETVLATYRDPQEAYEDAEETTLN